MKMERNENRGYVSPQIETMEIAMEQTLLNGSVIPSYEYDGDL